MNGEDFSWVPASPGIYDELHYPNYSTFGFSQLFSNYNSHNNKDSNNYYTDYSPLRPSSPVLPRHNESKSCLLLHFFPPDDNSPIWDVFPSSSSSRYSGGNSISPTFSTQFYFHCSIWNSFGLKISNDIDFPLSKSSSSSFIYVFI
jgi:hypothetical protein